MKPKLILCLALVLSSIYSTFAFFSEDQIKAAEQKLYPNILIRSKPDFNTGYRRYWVVVLPQNNIARSNSTLSGSLSIYEQTNLLAECPIEGFILQNIKIKKWPEMYEVIRYQTMTNLFSNPLNGAKMFTFRVATNVLETSRFNLYDRNVDDYQQWFYLKDFQ